MNRLVLLASVAAVAAVVAQPAAAQRSLPTFEVDKAWPKVPAGMKVGDVSSFSADAQDNMYLIHRPRTLKGDDLKNAAPPVMVFDQGGNYLRGWGGKGAGYDWPQREHGISVDYKGNIWLGGNNCPEAGLANLDPLADDQYLKFTPDGKFIMQIGKANSSMATATRPTCTGRPMRRCCSQRMRCSCRTVTAITA